MKYTILYVQSDEVVGKKIVDSFFRKNIDIIWLKTLSELKTKFENINPTILITDIELKDGNSIEYLENIRQNNSNLKIIIHSDSLNNENLSKIINLKVDKFINKNEIDIYKPISSFLFTSKNIEKKEETKRFFKKGYYYITETKELFNINNNLVKLTKKEKLIIELLLNNGKRYVSYSQLLNYLRTSKDISMESLRTMIKNIRNKTYQDFIKNYSGCGYKIDVISSLLNLNDNISKKDMLFDINVLLINDSEELNKNLIYELDRFNINCDSELSFEDAKIKLSEDDVYDYIIVGLELSDMQNFELIRNIKKHTSSKIITIIEKNDTRMREYLFLEGILDCIDKKKSIDYIVNALYKNIRNIESNKTFNQILVIDSSSIFCLECENFLSSRNYGVVSTSSFLEGMKKLSNKKYNLLILDLDILPDNQYEIISKIKREYENLPIILVSSVKDYTTVNDAYRSGASEFLQKPVFIEELILKIDSKTRANRQLEELLTNQQLLNDYKLIVDNASIVSKIDKNGILTYVNSACCNISGYDKLDLIGKPFSLVTHEDMPQDYFDDMWTTVRVKKTMWHGKTKNRRKDSSVYYVDSYVMPLLDEDGEILEFIALRNNINEEEYEL